VKYYNIPGSRRQQKWAVTKTKPKVKLKENIKDNNFYIGVVQEAQLSLD